MSEILTALGLLPTVGEKLKAFRERNETQNLIVLVSADIRSGFGLPESTAKLVAERVTSTLEMQWPIVEIVARILHDGGDKQELTEPLVRKFASQLDKGYPDVDPEVLARQVVGSIFDRSREAKKDADAALHYAMRRAERERQKRFDDLEERMRALSPAELAGTLGILARNALRLWGKEQDEPRKGCFGELRKIRAPLVRDFDAWLGAAPTTRDERRIRVYWLVCNEGEWRDDGVLACLDYAYVTGCTVGDAGRDLDALGKALADCLRAGVEDPLPVLAVALGKGISSKKWEKLGRLIERARSARHGPGEVGAALFVAGTAKQANAAQEALGELVYISARDGVGVPSGRAVSQTGVRTQTDRVYIRGLPMTAKKLHGREVQEAEIWRAWHRRETRVLSLVAFGGTGKSALANNWLHHMERDVDYDDAKRVLAWSFYSQGTRDNLVSADEFVTEAFKWFGYKRPVTLSAAARGHELAKLIMAQRTLLVLDGLEPLQYPSTDEEVGGALTDESLRTLLSELSENEWDGLCLITTRVPVKDLASYEQEPSERVERIDLEQLEPWAGAALLKERLGDVAEREDLETATKHVGCHALALTLLANYLRDVHGGRLGGVGELKSLAVNAGDGGHARRIMQSYARFLRDRRRQAELTLLRLMGLFDRPARLQAMACLLADEELKRLTGKLDSVDSERWSDAVEALREMGLLEQPNPSLAGMLDAHPLVREHFRADLKDNLKAAWTRANETLYGYYSTSAKPKPTNASDMQPLYAAVTHGCAAGLYQRVYDEVLLPRVWRDRRESYSTKRLGLTGADIAALSNYFDHHDWVTLSDRALTPAAETLIRTNAGVRLRQLGRLMNASLCFAEVLKRIEPERATGQQRADASYAAAQSCELLVIAGNLRAIDEGNVQSASAVGKRAVELADMGDDAYFAMHARSSLAEVQFMLGDTAAAEREFADAITIDRTHRPRPKPRFMYSQSLFRYGYHLIESDRAEEVLAMEQTPGWGEFGFGKPSSLLSKAIKTLVRGAARRALLESGKRRSVAMREETAELLDEAMLEFRTAGYPDYVARGLLERCRYRRVRRDWGGALQDHQRVARLLEMNQMGLLETDLRLERAACELDSWKALDRMVSEDGGEMVREQLDLATESIEQFGYGRRVPMLLELRDAASAAGVRLATSGLHALDSLA